MFRLRWAGLVPLLRAVGHVLDKVDGKASPETRAAIDKAWEAHKPPNPAGAIFWSFIEHERDNILKAYTFGAGVNRTFRPDWGPTTDNAFMRSGPFARRDPLDLAQLALDYWRTYLDEIDAETARLQNL